MSDLQELYLHLDHCDNGNKYIAWYGQLRAEGKSHDEAITLTLDRYRIREQEWYKKRFETRPGMEVK
jgi:hypothetical protein